jgi:hypothetical protein
MKYSPFAVALVLFRIMACATNLAASSAPHVRPTMPRASAVVVEGVVRSPTVRSLVDRLDRSDVVVYLECESFLPGSLHGQLAFITYAAGVRYVRVRLDCHLSAAQVIVTLGHELTHALEIAVDETVVDEATLRQLYTRIGHDAGWTNGTHRFDTDAANDAGLRIWQEIEAVAPRSADQPQ